MSNGIVSSNCRCTTYYKLKGFEKDYSPDWTYDEWEKEFKDWKKQPNTRKQTIDLSDIKNHSTRKEMEDFYSNAPDDMKGIVKRVYDKTDLYDLGEYDPQEHLAQAFYSPSKNAVVVTKGYASALPHEYGHAVDNFSGSNWSNQGKFAKALEKESKEQRRFVRHVKSYKKYNAFETVADRDEYLALKPDYDKLKEKLSPYMDRLRSLTENTPEKQALVNMGDIYTSIFKGEYSPAGGVGHASSYYRTKGAMNAEVFANLFALRDSRWSELYSVVKSDFPKIVELFEEGMKNGFTL